MKGIIPEFSFIFLVCLFMALPAWAQGGEGGASDSSRETYVVIPQAYVPQGTGSTGVAAVRRRIAQIRGEHVDRVVYPIIVPVPAAAPVSPSVKAPRSSDNPSSTADDDLARLHERIDELYRLLSRRDQAGAQVIVLPEGADSALVRSLLDSLRAFQGDTSDVVVSPPDLPPVVLPQPVVPVPAPSRTALIERTILETGLFRTTDVNFEFDESTLLPVSEATLDAVGEVLIKYPSLRVEVSGHTDSIGSDAYNQKLSEARAASVRRYLLETFSLAADRIQERGFGESRPVASNETPTGRTLNRRVEFRVLDR